MSEENMEGAESPKKKKKKGKLLLMVGAPLLALGGGGVYATQSGLISLGGGGDNTDTGPRLVPRSEAQRASVATENGAGTGGMPTPEGNGGEKYASSYYPLEKEFTSNLLDSVHFVQVGIAVSTQYDARVLENIKSHEIAIRSAVLLALGETSEEEVFTAEGKKRIQTRLTGAINAVLKEKEGFGGVSNVYFTNFIVQ